MALTPSSIGSGTSFNYAMFTDSVTGDRVHKSAACDATGAYTAPLKINDGITTLSSGAITNPTSTLVRPVNVTAYTADDLIASSVTAGTIVVPFFALASAGGGAVGGGAVISSLTLWTNATAGWGAASLWVRLWRVAPTYTNGDNGAYAVATGSLGWLATFQFSLEQFGDGAKGRAQLIDANTMALKLASGSSVFWDLQAKAAFTPQTPGGTGQQFTLTGELLN